VAGRRLVAVAAARAGLPDLTPVGAALLGYGITAVTDATPDLDEATIKATERAMFSAVLPQRVYLLGVPGRAQFDCASALLNYVLGLAGQYAAGARLIPRDTDRSAFLAAVAARWAQLDPAEYPFVHQVATQLPGHDDREQFLAGIDLILAGITTVR
jgi:hypothetical protein